MSITSLFFLVGFDKIYLFLGHEQVVQSLVWYRQRSGREIGGRGLVVSNSSELPRSYRDVSLNERDWAESLLVEIGEGEQQDDSALKSHVVEGSREDTGEKEEKKTIGRMLAEGQKDFEAKLSFSRGRKDMEKLKTAEDFKGPTWKETTISSSGSIENVLSLLRTISVIGRHIGQHGLLDGTHKLKKPVLANEWLNVSSACAVKSLASKVASQLQVRAKGLVLADTEGYYHGNNYFLYYLLQDPVSIISGSWPNWCDDASTLYSELLPLEVRIQYFKSASFSNSRVRTDQKLTLTV